MPKIVFPPSANTYITQYYPDQNFNRSQSLFVGQYQQAGTTYRSLLKFDNSNIGSAWEQIPHDSIINKAYLHLAIERNEIPAGSSIRLNVFAILQHWNSSIVTWKTQPLIHAVSESSTTIASGYGVVKLDLTTLIRNWFERHIYNEGILLTGDENRDTLVAFYSNFSRNNSLWPRLSIEFSA